MLQIEELFRRSLKRKGRRPASMVRPEMNVVHNRSQETAEEIVEILKEEEMFEPEEETLSEIEPDSTQESENIPESEPQEGSMVQDTAAETEEPEHITEQIEQTEQTEQDVTDMTDMKKQDFLLQQIDEFREKAKQLQVLMKNRETKAEELQGVVNEREAKANELDNLLQVRKGEADKIMKNVSVRINEMSAGVRNEMSSLTDTLSRELGSVEQNLAQEVSGLSQNLTQEINQSTEKTRQTVESATQHVIDQNTRSLEGLKEQLEQIDQREQLNELSTEMNSQITTLKADIVDKIHAEDVKCYRNIQVSLDDQSKLLSEGDEKTRQYIQEQVDSLNRQVKSQAKFVNTALFFSIINFLGIVGILVVLFLF